MLTADYLDSLPDSILELYEEFQQSVIDDIVRRLVKMGSPTATAAWQMQRLSEAGFVYEDIIKKIAAITGQSEKELIRLFSEAGVKATTFDNAIYKAAGLDPTPLNLSPMMYRVLVGGINKTAGSMRNLTLTTAISGQEAFIKAADQAYMQVISGAFDYNTAIRNAITEVGSSGLDVIYQATGKRDKLDVAMRRSVLTGVNQTVGQIKTAQMDEMGIDLVQTSAHMGARPTHQLWQGKIFSRSGRSKKYPDFVQETGYGTVTGLMGINCVLGDTRVSGPRISAGYRRKYSGEVVIIHTASGHELSVTPNHPILTENGWVAAGLLTKGDKVFSRSNFNRKSGISPNVNQSEPTIKKVFDAFAVSRPVGRLSISSGDFHGDISVEHEVDIVFPDSLLGNRRKAHINQQGIKVFFGLPDHLPDTLLALSALDKVGVGAFHSSNSFMSRSGHGRDFIISHSGNSVTHSIRSIVCNWDAELCEIFSDRTFGNASRFGDFVFPHSRFIHPFKINGFDSIFTPDIGFPIRPSINPITLETIDDSMNRTVMFISNGVGRNSVIVQLDNIINIKIKHISSIPVYNLETSGNWYFANNIITHNCRHNYYPFFEGISENAYSEADRRSYANKTVTYKGEEISFYEATQKQRAIERKIREWKRQAGALEAGGLDNTKAILKVREWQGAMREFVKQTRLNRQYVREQI
jgi:hypothetical protein